MKYSIPSPGLKAEEESLIPAAIPFEPHARNIAAFIDSVETGKPFEVDGTEARKAVEIILAIYSSAKGEETDSHFQDKNTFQV